MELVFILCIQGAVLGYIAWAIKRPVRNRRTGTRFPVSPITRVH